MEKLTFTRISAVIFAAAAALTGCSGVDSNFSADYVAAIMDASYKGEFEHYLSMTDASDDSAEEIIYCIIISTICIFIIYYVVFFY